ncbi:MAG TPA: TetR/AcrR family transcriptional regulator [Solirubrobacteraceae bacterium]|nr:TetR/AcrR family transcriptional regulator [Solirubrobacteraceae bacterium]
MVTKARRIRRSPEAAEREILAAAEAAVAERPFRELSVDELMGRTGMTRSTFYHYFRSLDEVAVALLRRVQAEMMEAARPWIEAPVDEDPAGVIERAIHDVAVVYAQHGPVLAAIHEASFQYEAVQRAWREGTLAEWIAAVANRLREQRDHGLTRVEEPEEVARALLLMNTAVFVERLGMQPADAPAQVAATLSRVWVGALYPELLVARPRG